MVKTTEKQNAERKNHSAPLMNHPIVSEEAEDKKMKSESSKSRFLGEIHLKPQIEEEEEVKETQIDENFRPAKMREYLKRKANESVSEKKNTIIDDREEELEKMRSKRRNLDGELRTPQAQTAGKSRIGSSTDGKKNTILGDKEWELKKMRSKRRNLDGELRTPQAQTAGKSRIGSSTDGKKNTILDAKEEELEKVRSKRRNLDGELRTPRAKTAGKSRISYSIDGKKLPKPAFGYSIDGQKLPKHPQIEETFEIIGDCSDPFEIKLLKTDVDRIILNRHDVNKGIRPYLKEDEKAKLTRGGILVNTYDEFGYHYEMKFESYFNCYYKLCNGWKRLWKRFFKSHKLNGNEDCYVAVWMFRNKHTGGVCFAVTLKEVKVQD